MQFKRGEVDFFVKNKDFFINERNGPALVILE